MAVEVPAGLLLATAASDALGLAAASFYLLVVGVPVTAVAGLACFARVVDAVNEGSIDVLGRLQALLSGAVVAVVVVGAAVRRPGLEAGVVAPEATAVLALGFALLILQALVALVPIRRERAQ